MSKKVFTTESFRTFMDTIKGYVDKMTMDMVNEINIPNSVSQLENDSGYLTISDIIVSKTEDWEFTLEDGYTIVTKPIVTSSSFAYEDLIFELEDGSTISKKVVVET